MKRILIITIVVMMAVMQLASAYTGELTIYDKWSPVGGAEAECAAAGGTCGDSAFKIESWANQTNDTGDNIIIISNSDGYTFDWDSDDPVCKVIVKADGGANVYYYEGGAYNDTGLVTYTNTTIPRTYEISHITFCYTDDGGGTQEIPEFPTIALPVAAILGLAFIMQRRKE